MPVFPDVRGRSSAPFAGSGGPIPYPWGMISTPRLIALACLGVLSSLNATGEDLRPDTSIDITLDWLMKHTATAR